MATTSTIGTSSRNYSTIQAWHDAFTTGGWIGECYNDSEFVESPSMTGKATSATDYVILRAASGQSFNDHANVQTNALRYNQTNGVAIKGTNSYGPTISIGENYITVTGLQSQGNTASSSSCFGVTNGVTSSIVAEYCIFDNGNASNGAASVQGGGNSPNIATFRNCLMVVNTNANAVVAFYGQKFYNCTVVRSAVTAPTGTAFLHNYSANTYENVALFGFTTLEAGSGTSTVTTCMTDLASPPTGWTGGKTYTSQFVDTGATVGNRDFRAKTGADILDAGTTDSTNVPNANDIAKTARPQGSAWDIGAWELVVAAAPSTKPRPPQVIIFG